MSGINVIHYYKRKLGSGICWVIALGTNDAASSQKPNDSERITLTMEAIDGDPVLWINVWMNSKTRPNYSISAACTWNTLLLKELSIYYNAHIYDWAFFAKNNSSWFISDGYHYSSIGSKLRSQKISQAAALYF